MRYPDGYVQLRDRSKDIIISGGENISSIEVEDRLYRHPAVAMAAVVAKPDDKWGEVPCAFVELKPGASATEAELIAFCREGLAGFKTPKQVVFTELPRTSTGKIQKHVLRSQVRPPGLSGRNDRRAERDRACEAGDADHRETARCTPHSAPLCSPLSWRCRSARPSRRRSRSNRRLRGPARSGWAARMRTSSA